MLTTTLVVAPVQAVVTGPSSFAPGAGLPGFDPGFEDSFGDCGDDGFCDCGEDGSADGDAAIGCVDGFDAGVCAVEDVSADGFEEAADSPSP
ncbi:hypothetical protein ABZ957_31800 [Streptomyces sp. NPDC046316]|uniref:hypothetical protein n=1 Tax=unclassified Streptomyces TaxID=2593676 RepID=UPI0033E59F92